MTHVCISRSFWRGVLVFAQMCSLVQSGWTDGGLLSPPTGGVHSSFVSQVFLGQALATPDRLIQSPGDREAAKIIRSVPTTAFYARPAIEELRQGVWYAGSHGASIFSAAGFWPALAVNFVFALLHIPGQNSQDPKELYPYVRVDGKRSAQAAQRWSSAIQTAIRMGLGLLGTGLFALAHYGTHEGLPHLQSVWGTVGIPIVILVLVHWSYDILVKALHEHDRALWLPLLGSLKSARAPFLANPSEHPPTLFEPNDPRILEILGRTAERYDRVQSAGVTDLRDLQTLATALNPDFSQWPAETLARADWKTFVEFVWHLHWRIFLPARLDVKFPLEAGRHVPLTWVIDDKTWRWAPYGDSGIWMADMSSTEPPRARNSRVLGQSLGPIALIDRAGVAEDAHEEYRLLLGSPLESPLDHRAHRLIHEMTDQGRLDNDLYARHIRWAMTEAEERREAQAFRFTERRGHSTLESDFDQRAEIVDEIVKPDSPLYQRYWVHAEKPLGAVPILELESKLGATMDVMKECLASPNPDMAYLAFLQFWRGVQSMNAERQILLREGSNPLDSIVLYNSYAQFAISSLIRNRAAGFTGLSSELFGRILNDLQDARGVEIAASNAFALMEALYAMHFWTTEERDSRWPDWLWWKAARTEGIDLNPGSRIGVFLGGLHIQGEYYYKLFTHTITQLFGDAVDLVYLPYAVDRDDPASAQQMKILEDELLNNPRLVGAVVTRPWKDAFLSYAVDPSAGAVNFIVKSINGRLHGYAVDGEAWVAGLEHDLHHPYDFSGKTVVILGMGGAAKELAAALFSRHVGRIIFSDPDPAKYESMANMLSTMQPPKDWVLMGADRPGIPFAPLHQAIQGADIVVNATGIGRGATLGQSPLSGHDCLRGVPIVSDLISGVNTRFLQEARRQKVPHVFTGESMFIFGMVHFIRGWVEQIRPDKIAVDFSLQAYQVISDYLKARWVKRIITGILMFGCTWHGVSQGSAHRRPLAIGA